MKSYRSWRSHFELNNTKILSNQEYVLRNQKNKFSLIKLIKVLWK